MGTVLDITERKLAEERQLLLMAELDHRVKNILGNVCAIARLSSHKATSVDAFVKALEGRIQAISRAHALLRRVAWRGANLLGLVTEALAAFRSRSDSNIEVNGEAIYVVPELTQALALVIHELATNAIKYGALSAPAGSVSVSWSKVADEAPGTLRFVWRERGGPPVTPPAKHGFGLTVLTTAAQDLGATASCDFDADGLVYTLKGPFEAAQGILGLELAANDQPSDTATNLQNGKGCKILVVEDEGLIALQLQAHLEDAGHSVVGPARSLVQGLRLAESESIDAALVDISLGRDSSAPIADRLLARSVPFAFATGYSDSAMLPEHLRSIPRLNKPYAVEEVRRVVDGLVTRTA
jgi:two-component sensor histidine kinase